MATRRIPNEVIEDESEVTTSADLGFTQPEIEVDPITPLADTPGEHDGMVEVRMSETIEDFTFGNPHVHHRLERGKRYRMPLHIAIYLDSLGYVWH